MSSHHAVAAMEFVPMACHQSMPPHSIGSSLAPPQTQHAGRSTRQHRQQSLLATCASEASVGALGRTHRTSFGGMLRERARPRSLPSGSLAAAALPPPQVQKRRWCPCCRLTVPLMGQRNASGLLGRRVLTKPLGEIQTPPIHPCPPHAAPAQRSDRRWSCRSGT